MPAEVPHSRCSGSLLNNATPPPNRAQTASPATSQTRGMVTTDCHPVDAAVASSPPAPVVDASTRVSRLHTRYILRPALGVACPYLPPDQVADRQQRPAEPVADQAPQALRGDQRRDRGRP